MLGLTLPAMFMHHFASERGELLGWTLPLAPALRFASDSHARRFTRLFDARSVTTEWLISR
jgi:hypothetical protein